MYSIVKLLRGLHFCSHPLKESQAIWRTSVTNERRVNLQDYAYYSIDEYCNALREDRHVVSSAHKNLMLDEAGIQENQDS